MATTVGQHSVAAFTSPINGTTPIDANTVRSNDNTVRLAYVDHDADTGIHVQSSTLASRPVAGTAGRKWITEDSGVYTLWFDDGTNWHPVSSENVALTVLCTTALNKGDVVKVIGWNNGQDLPEVAKVSSASDIAFAIMTANATINTMGYATNTGTVQDINTAAFALGDILYPSASGGFTTTKPTSGLYQIVGYVLRSNASNGVVFVEFTGPRIVEASANTVSTVVQRDASGNFSAGTITANLTGNVTGNVTGNITGTAPAGTLTGTTLASNVVSSSLTSVGTLSSLTVSGATTLSAGAAATPALTTSGDTNTGLFFPATDTIAFATSGLERMRLDSSGNLGIGVTPSTNNGGSVLQVGAISGLMGTNTESYINTNATFNTTWQYISTAATSQYRQSNGQHIWRIAASGSAGTTITWTEAMRLDVSGNLGLGVTPSAWSGFRAMEFSSVAIGELGYLRNAYWNGTSYIYRATAAASHYQLGSTGEHVWFRAPSGTAGNAITFTQAMTLDASGNLGLGATPSTASIRTLQVQNTSLSSPGSNMYLTANAVFDTPNWKYISTGFVSQYAQLNGGHQWLNAASGTAGTNVSFTPAMTLDASGNLGVGATPVYRLDAQFGAGSGNIFRAGQTSVSNGYTITTSGTALTHTWANAGSNTMTLDTSGNLALAAGYLRVGGASAGAASTTTIGNTTATTVGAAGGASALPATPLGYIIAHVGTTQVKIPYYTA